MEKELRAKAINYCKRYPLMIEAMMDCYSPSSRKFDDDPRRSNVPSNPTLDRVISVTQLKKETRLIDTCAAQVSFLYSRCLIQHFCYNVPFALLGLNISHYEFFDLGDDFLNLIASKMGVERWKQQKV